MSGGAGTATDTLVGFLHRLAFDDLPAPVVERTAALFLDWLGSAWAGRNARPVAALEAFAQAMGPAAGPSECLTHRQRTSPYFAALVNGAASHVVEQDDLHNASVVHPATVVFPAALAAAQAVGASGRALVLAAVVGYEMATRVGAFLGRSHYRVFHTTGTAGTLGAAAAVGRLLDLDAEAYRHALGSAGTEAAGLWEFLRDAADSKQLHTAKAAADGLLAAWTARAGLTGARQILEGPQGMAAGMSTDADPARLVEGLGTRWAVLETSLKYHASCRHTHPAADALLQAMARHGLKAGDIRRVTARVHQAAVDVLGPVTDPRTVHQSKFSMGFVLGLVATRGHAAVTDFDPASLADPAVRAFMPRVEMVVDPEVDRRYPAEWIGVVEVETVDGRRIVERVEVPKGDPGNFLDRAELEDKVRRLAAFGGGVRPEEVETAIRRAWRLPDEPHVRDWLAPADRTAAAG
ncbi:MAG: MmgE/PrpD family protein [Actinomycetia bacterium]|nr:MmgE/PrpD family protein [Actinomycetes bacterium]